MTSTQSRTVDHAALKLGKRLGQGGQGTVYEVLNRTFTVGPGPAWEVVFKEYDAGLLPALDAAALNAMVDLLFGLSATEGVWLCDRAAWPATVVERQGRVCGFLMRAVPDSFRFDLRSLAGTASSSRRLANVEYLLNSDAYAAGIGLTISDSDRVALLADLSSTLSRLHRLGIVVGDLSPKNLLFRTTPEVRCFLIDCDAMRLNGATVLPQAETPDWQLPSGEEKATRSGDIYKLGLLAARLFERDQTTTDPASLTAVSPTLGTLAQASLSGEPGKRPSPSQWTELASAATHAIRIAPPPPPPRPPQPGQSPGSTTPQPPFPLVSPLLLAVAVIVIIVLATIVISSRSHPHDPGTPAATTVAGQNGYSTTYRPTYTYTTPTHVPVTRIGMVDLAPSLADDSRAIAVARTLDTYFTAINQRDYDTFIGVLAPSLRPQDYDDFIARFGTTTDRNVEVWTADSGPTARVTFQSSQAPDQAPRGLDGATCVNWDMTYFFTSGYLIYKSSSNNGGPTAC